jgi:hypothetical protein
VYFFAAPPTNGHEHSVELGLKQTEVNLEVKNPSYTKGIDVQQVNITCMLHYSLVYFTYHDWYLSLVPLAIVKVVNDVMISVGYTNCSGRRVEYVGVLRIRAVLRRLRSLHRRPQLCQHHCLQPRGHDTAATGTGRVLDGLHSLARAILWAHL